MTEDISPPGFGRRVPVPSWTGIAPKTPGAWRSILEGAGWFVLGGLALAGLSGTLTLVGFFLIIPGVILLAAPTAFLYALALQAPRLVWNDTRAWAPTLGAGAFMLALFCAPGLYVNSKLDRFRAQAMSEDFGALPSLPSLESVALMGQRDSCSDLCESLLERGLVRTVYYRSLKEGPVDLGVGLGPALAYRVGSPGDCTREGGTQMAQACILRRLESAPQPQVVVVEGPGGTPPLLSERQEQRQRWDLLATGPMTQRPLEVWTCAAGRCVKVMRRTEVRTQPLHAPIWVGYGGSGFSSAWREWGRSKKIQNEINLEGTIKEIAGQPPRARSGVATYSAPTRLERVVPLSDVTSGKADQEGLKTTIDRWNEQSTPLNQSQIATLRKLIQAPPKGLRTIDWNAHPEAADALADDLAALLLTTQDQGARWQAQAGLANLSPETYRRVSPQIVTYIQGAYGLPGYRTDDAFMVRLGETGPATARRIGEIMARKEGFMTISSGSEQEMVLALCRMGRDGASAAPMLRAEQAHLANQKVDSAYSRLLALALRRVTTGSPGKSECLATVGKNDFNDAWLERMRAADRRP